LKITKAEGNNLEQDNKKSEVEELNYQYEKKSNGKKDTCEDVIGLHSLLSDDRNRRDEQEIQKFQSNIKVESVTQHQLKAELAFNESRIEYSLCKDIEDKWGEIKRIANSAKREKIFLPDFSIDGKQNDERITKAHKESKYNMLSKLQIERRANLANAKFEKRNYSEEQLLKDDEKRYLESFDDFIKSKERDLQKLRAPIWTRSATATWR
jgi:1,4-alpha-glucan branching enzyme